MREDSEPIQVHLRCFGERHDGDPTAWARTTYRDARESSLRSVRAGLPADGPLLSQPMSPAEATTDSRRSPKWIARRRAIIDTSAGIFAQRGYHATGITELCAANDLGKGALYHYIGSKEELLAAIHDRVMDEVMTGAERVAQAGGSPSQQLAMLGR